MKNKEELRDELKNLSPFLWEQKKRPEGFEVPKDYFKSLPDEVFEKISAAGQTTKAPKETWWVKLMENVQALFQPRYALAYASVALLVMAGTYYKTDSSAQEPTPQMAEAILDQIPDEELQDYIADNIDDFDESMFEEELAKSTDESLPEFELGNPDELLDELIDDLNMDELDDLL